MTELPGEISLHEKAEQKRMVTALWGKMGQQTRVISVSLKRHRRVNVINKRNGNGGGKISIVK